MADTFTTNLNLTKPDIGGSTDTWGNKLNANADALDAMFPSGDLAVVNGGTGASDAATARANLGLGSMATQNASAVSITGGSAAVSTVALNAAAPWLGWQETDAPVDNKWWRIYADGQQWTLRLYNDGLSNHGTALTVTRAGTSPSVVNVGTTLQVSGQVVYHAGNISSASITETQIADGTVLARVAGNETVSGTWNFTTRPTVSGNGVLDSTSSLAWARLTGVPSTFTPSTHTHDENSITNGTLLARVADNETISGNWTFSGTMTKSGQGRIPYLVGSGNTGGAITVSTSDPSGTPANGDLWIKYVP